MKTLTTALIFFIYVNAAFASDLTNAANGGVGEDVRNIYRAAISKCSSPSDDPEACLRLLSSIPDSYEDTEYYLGFGYQKEADLAKRKQLSRTDVIIPLDDSYKAFSNYATTNKRYSIDSKKRAAEAGKSLLSALNKDLTEKIELVDQYIDSLKNQNVEPENVFYNARTALSQAEEEIKRFNELKDELDRLYHIKSNLADNSLDTKFDNLKIKYKKQIIDSGYEDKMYEALSMDRKIALKLKNRQPDSSGTNRSNNPDREQYSNCIKEAKKECKGQYGYGTADYSTCYYRAEDACAKWCGIR